VTVGLGCSGSTGGATLVVTVKAANGMPPVSQLRVVLNNGGATIRESFPAVNAGTPLT